VIKTRILEKQLPKTQNHSSLGNISEANINDLATRAGSAIGDNESKLGFADELSVLRSPIETRINAGSILSSNIPENTRKRLMNHLNNRLLLEQQKNYGTVGMMKMHRLATKNKYAESTTSLQGGARSLEGDDEEQPGGLAAVTTQKKGATGAQVRSSQVLNI
jgi:hypothetical protein